jgi:photosystem II stability/assembly factor-like uncharacterized protein
MLLLAMLLTVRLAPDVAGTEYRQPQLVTGNGIVALTFGAGNAVYFASSPERELRFSKPVKVVEAGKLALGRHRGPRIAVTSSSIVISAIAGEKGGGADGDLLAWRSTDGGKSWSQGVAVNDVPAAAREGLHAMASDGKNLLFTAWLDLRAKGTRLYGSASSDGGKTWSRNVLVYESPEGTICQCCHPSVAFDGNGRIYVMWRNVLAGNRDMYVVRSADGGKTFQQAEKLGRGAWELNACPMDGGGLGLTSRGQVVSAWRRQQDIFLAPAGGTEKRIDHGKDPAIVVSNDQPYLAWSGMHGIRALVPGKPEPIHLAEEGGFVQLAVTAGGMVIAAWESNGSIITAPLSAR